MSVLLAAVDNTVPSERWHLERWVYYWWHLTTLEAACIDTWNMSVLLAVPVLVLAGIPNLMVSSNAPPTCRPSHRQYTKHSKLIHLYLSYPNFCNNLVYRNVFTCLFLSFSYNIKSKTSVTDHLPRSTTPYIDRFIWVSNDRLGLALCNDILTP